MGKHRPGSINIGILNRIGRFAYGIFFLLAGVWMRDFFAINHFDRFFFTMLFIPFYLGFVGIFQAATGYCLYHHTKGTCDMR